MRPYVIYGAREIAGDLDAIVVYLRSLPPVRNAVAAPTYRAPVGQEAFALADRGFSERDMDDKVRRGAYLTTIAHCMECHTPMGPDHRQQYAIALDKLHAARRRQAQRRTAMVAHHGIGIGR